MDQINTSGTRQTDIGRLFADCGPNGGGTTLTSNYMNGVMMELINVIRKSGQQPIAFNESIPDSYDQVYQAIKVICTEVIAESGGGDTGGGDTGGGDTGGGDTGGGDTGGDDTVLTGVSISAPLFAYISTVLHQAIAEAPDNAEGDVTYAWVLPDGTTKTGKEVTFDAPSDTGIYEIELTVTDASNQSISISRPFQTIGNQPLLSTVTITSPFLANSGSQNLNASVSDPTNGLKPFRYEWITLDGTAATGKAITFNAPPQSGNYTLAVTIIDLGGARRTYSKTISVI